MNELNTLCMTTPVSLHSEVMELHRVDAAAKRAIQSLTLFSPPLPSPRPLALRQNDNHVLAVIFLLSIGSPRSSSLTSASAVRFPATSKSCS